MPWISVLAQTINVATKQAGGLCIFDLTFDFKFFKRDIATTTSTKREQLQSEWKLKTMRNNI